MLAWEFGTFGDKDEYGSRVLTMGYFCLSEICEVEKGS